MTIQGIRIIDDCNELEKKIDSITQYNSKPCFSAALKRLDMVNSENANVICDYILAEQIEMNIKESKTVPQLTKQDILEYLNNLKRAVLEDSTHKWIGSYNG
ncbi:MAG: hypothetical protein WBE34_04630 [Candidatus Nitrosopolaris sp.]